MFDFDASKLLIIGVVALIVIGPKDLPGVLRQVGQAVTKLRRMAAEFQGQFMDAMKEADLQDLRQEVSKLKNTASLDVVFNPVADVKAEITRAVGTASVAVERPAAAEPVPSSLVGVDLPGAAPGPSLLDQANDPVRLEPAVAAAHTQATAAGAVHAIEPAADGPGARRRILVAKRRPPGDRVATAPGAANRGRSLLPPRRDPRP